MYEFTMNGQTVELPKDIAEDLLSMAKESRMNEMWDRTKANAIEGAYTATANTLVSGVRMTIASQVQDEGLRALINSELGDVAISGVLSTVLMMAPLDVIKNDPRAQKLADKLQQKAVADGLTKIMELATALFLPSIVQALNSLPKETAQLRVETVEQVQEPVIEVEEPEEKKRTKVAKIR
jgi:hypothetical protein